MTEVNEPKNSRSQLPKQTKKSKINKWKVAFLILLGVVIGTFAFIMVRVTQVREPNLKATPEIVEKKGEPVITIQSKKQQVNDLIDFYLQDFQKDTDIQYKFYLENEALLNGTFQVLGHDMEFYLYFDPYVMENGNVQLKAKSLSIGSLGLPVKEILKFVKRDYKLPKWVEVNPEDKTVLLRLDQFRMQNGLFIRADKINLIDDNIQMSIYLPKE